MKHLPIYLLLLSLTSRSFGQDWNPVPGNLTLIYKYFNTQIFRTSLMAAKSDSVVMEGLNSVHYFYRIDRQPFPGETAIDCNSQPISPAFILGQDHWFGKKMVLRPDGDCHFISSNADSFLLRSKAPQGSSWAWDDTTTATVSAITAATIFGQPDSVKVIVLSNGNTLRLSKSHGLIAAYNFFSHDDLPPNLAQCNLWGIPELALGGKLPGFDGMYDFQVGDRFGYLKSYHSFPFGGYTRNSDVHLEITSVIPGSNPSYLALIKVVNDLQDQQFGDHHFEFPVKDTVLTFPHAAAAHLDLLPFKHQSDLSNGPYTMIQTGAYFWEEDTTRIVLSFAFGFAPDTCSNTMFDISIRGEAKYLSGVGLWTSNEYGNDYTDHYIPTCFHTASGDYLECPVMGLTIDTIPQFNFISYPNPVNDLLHLNFYGSAASDLHVIRIYSALGSLVRTHVVPKGTNAYEIEASDLLAGMYIMKIEQKGHDPIVKRFIVEH